VAAAREAFFSKGYGATSMSSISATVGGSKTTLWTCFPSKEELFAAVVDDLVERYGRALEVPFDPDSDIAESLRRMGHALLETVHSQPIVDLHRLCIGEAGRFPELARLFHERGPARGKGRLRAYVAELMARGRLRAGDPVDASLTFVGRLWAGSIQSHLIGLIERPDDAEMAREIEAAVDAFMRAWAI
jgi:AcrR family transcriptional regulator